MSEPPEFLSERTTMTKKKAILNYMFCRSSDASSSAVWLLLLLLLLLLLFFVLFCV